MTVLKSEQEYNTLREQVLSWILGYFPLFYIETLMVSNIGNIRVFQSTLLIASFV
jgi:hypothetical protein